MNGFDFRTNPGAALRPRPHWSRHRPPGAARTGFKIVGAVDIDPAKVGRDLGEIAGSPNRCGVKVSGDARKTHQGGQAGRRRVLHELVDEAGGAADRGDR